MAQGPPPRFFNRPSSAKLGVDPMSKSLQMEVLNALAGLKKPTKKHTTRFYRSLIATAGVRSAKTITARS
jgi:hypothetical protein